MPTGKAFGLSVIGQAPPGLAFFDAGGVRLMLGRPEGESGGTCVLYFKVDDIAAAAATLQERGAFFRDSEGNIHVLMSEVARR